MFTLYFSSLRIERNCAGTYRVTVPQSMGMLPAMSINIHSRAPQTPASFILSFTNTKITIPSPPLKSLKGTTFSYHSSAHYRNAFAAIYRHISHETPSHKRQCKASYKEKQYKKAQFHSKNSPGLSPNTPSWLPLPSTNDVSTWLQHDLSGALASIVPASIRKPQSPQIPKIPIPQNKFKIMQLQYSIEQPRIKAVGSGPYSRTAMALRYSATHARNGSRFRAPPSRLN